jgi:sugar phosphate isomerase/epimerase
MTRRQLFQAAAAAALPLRSRAASAPSYSFPADPNQRIAIASYPFRDFMRPKKGSLTLLDFPKMVADRFGVFAIEPLDAHFPSLEPSYLDKLKKALDAARSRVANIPVGRLRASFYDPDPEKRKLAVDDARRWVDAAATLGAPSIRAHIREAQGAKPDAQLAASALTSLAVYGESRNIVITLENDDPRSEEGSFIGDVLAAANTPWLRALPDFCNSMLAGKGEDYNDEVLTRLFARAYSICHVKDSEDDGPKHYAVGVSRIFLIAHAAGFRGFYSMEWDAAGDPYSNTAHLVELTRKALAGAAS